VAAPRRPLGASGPVASDSALPYQCRGYQYNGPHERLSAAANGHYRGQEYRRHEHGLDEFSAANILNERSRHKNQQQATKK